MLLVITLINGENFMKKKKVVSNLAKKRKVMLKTLFSFGLR